MVVTVVLLMPVALVVLVLVPVALVGWAVVVGAVRVVVTRAGFRWLPGMLVSGVSAHHPGSLRSCDPGLRRYLTLSICANLRTYRNSD
jgi:hypothetical protein